MVNSKSRIIKKILKQKIGGGRNAENLFHRRLRAVQESVMEKSMISSRANLWIKQEEIIIPDEPFFLDFHKNIGKNRVVVLREHLMISIQRAGGLIA